MKDALGSVQSVLVLGGGSDIARATCEALVRRRHARVVLAARKPEDLADTVAAIIAAGASAVETVAFDATDFATHQEFVTSTFDRFGDFDVVLVAFGVLGDQATAETDGAAAVEIVETNFTGVVSVTVPVAQRLEQQGHGSLVLLSSVAGERARRSNFVYGSSKAGVDAFYQGLGDSLAGRGVHVMIVRPGFVTTKMTEGLEPAPLSTTPEAVARGDRAGTRAGTRDRVGPTDAAIRHVGAAAPAAPSVPAPEDLTWRSCGERHGRRPPLSGRSDGAGEPSRRSTSTAPSRGATRSYPSSRASPGGRAWPWPARPPRPRSSSPATRVAIATWPRRACSHGS